MIEHVARIKELLPPLAPKALESTMVADHSAADIPPRLPVFPVMASPCHLFLGTPHDFEEEDEVLLSAFRESFHLLYPAEGSGEKARI